MMIETTRGVPIDEVLLEKYMQRLVNLFFKILPIRESEDETLETYMQSLQVDLLGCSELVVAIHHDPDFLSLISILQFLIDNSKSPVAVYRREVFKAISICNKLKGNYCGNRFGGG